MKDSAPAGPVGVVCGPDDARKAALEAYLTRREIRDTKWFAPGELHDLDREVRRGRMQRVIFLDQSDLFEGIWEEEIVFEEWPASVALEFAESSGDDAMRGLAASWRAWRQRHRRRQAVAGVVLSAIVLAASFVLCVLLARLGR